MLPATAGLPTAWRLTPNTKKGRKGMGTRNIAALLGSAGLLVLGSGAMVGAQAQQAPAEAGKPVGLEEVVVTAQKREQRLQSVPISITAINAESIKANRIETLADLNAAAPNLSVRLGAGGNQSPNYTLRGILGASSAAGQDKGVSPYLDGVYLQAQSGSLFELADIERIEVLKGPQGTLFGRNATGGAIQIITKDPTGEFGGYQEFSAGNLGIFRSKTHVELPAFGPVSAYVTYLHSQRDGDTRNLGAGTQWNYLTTGSESGILTSPSRLGDDDTNAVMAAVKYSSDQFDLIYKGDYTHDDYTPNAEGADYLPATLGGPTAPNLVYNAYKASPNPMTPITNHRPDAVNNWFATPSLTENWGHNLTAKYFLNDAIQFKNILALRQTKNVSTFQLDGLGGLVNVPIELAPGVVFPPGAIQLGPGQNPKLASFVPGAPFLFLGNNGYNREWQWSDEFQVNVNTDWMTLTAGFLHFYDHITTGGFADGYNTTLLQVVAGQNTPLNGTPFVIPGNPGYRGAIVQTFSNAVFAQPEFHVTDQLDVVAGIRWTQDQKDGHESFPDQQLNPGVSPIYYKHSQITYLGGLNYKLDEDTLLYGKFSTGFVSGGTLSTLTYKPEKARSWELGVKTEQFDRRVRSNLALFDARYSNLQYDTSGLLTGVPATARFSQAIVNQGDAHALGFELENTVAVTSAVTLTANVGYTNFKYEQATIPPGLASLSGPPGFKPFQRPNFTGTLGAQYTSDELWWGSHLTARLDANFRSETLMTSNTCCAVGSTASDPAIIKAATSPFVWLVNGRVALADIDLGDTKAEVALWGRNLLDDREITQFVGLNLVGAVIYEQARTFGVDVRFDFSAPSEPEAAPVAYTPPPVQAPAPPHSYLVFFDFNKSDLTLQAEQIVDQAAANAGPAKVTRLTVTGHTDTVGSDAYNMRLSRRRAESVAARLEKDGIPSSEIEIVAKGKRDLLVPTADGVREPQNRRVQIVYSGGPTS
jgi:iron complex outermembrane receptor protein